MGVKVEQRQLLSLEGDIVIKPFAEGDLVAGDLSDGGQTPAAGGFWRRLRVDLQGSIGDVDGLCPGVGRVAPFKVEIDFESKFQLGFCLTEKEE